MAGATVHSMYKDVRSRLRVGDGYSKDIGVRVGLAVGVHQGSVLSLLLFIIVLELLSMKFCTVQAVHGRHTVILFGNFYCLIWESFPIQKWPLFSQFHVF